MCGIAVIVSGIRVDVPDVLPDPVFHAPPSDQLLFSVDETKAALRRRGPDSLGCKNVVLHYKNSSSVEEQNIVSSIEQEEATGDCLSSTSGETCKADNGFGINSLGHLYFVGATLQLRGMDPVVQPLMDAFGNILVYNGEIFGGIHVSSNSNDGEILMQYLGSCCACSSSGHTITCSRSGKGQNSVPDLLSIIKGPWALIYWQHSTKTMWFGRDGFGRRSLLVHWPTSGDSRLLLTSVSPPSSLHESSDLVDESGMGKLNFWEELSCGVYSLSIHTSNADENLVGKVEHHEWTNPNLKELIKWERTSVEPKYEELHNICRKTPCEQQDMQSAALVKMPSGLGPVQASVPGISESLLTALRESVARRSTLSTLDQAVTRRHENGGSSPVAVLFSGGLDSMIIAALLDECLEPKYSIELLNVSFDGQLAPDRISARAGVKELQKIAPLRRWKLVEIDADLLTLTSETKHVMSLINPARTYMDLNIGLALWLAANGNGWLNDESSKGGDAGYQRLKYKSTSRIVLVGSGADEQCAGYGRHKTKYRQGSWVGLNEEMKLDMQRIWKRNLGRDDRCIADSGKEARFPFLDEDVIKTLLDIPLWEIADLDQPSGIGDKKILREVARLLGLHEVAVLPKRAIQFGSRIARESNRRNFGSNRAANQASAGSVAIYGPSSFM
ncbi:hypothetical protein RJ640_008006 [Escallonia rubra]|uniref:Glutamine amidotransferase type-2 domain-containing protein n=1 Tax=Escallonia rubra TaxID=112253 RepID=A0AA88U3Z4_9ASTE|nr:hypothetical protein RJ640_008006 [Escallonia rubra]